MKFIFSAFNCCLLFLAAIPLTIFLIKRKDLGTLDCWVNGRGDIASPTELSYPDEVNVADKWCTWFVASICLYSIQEMTALVFFISGWVCREDYWPITIFYWAIWPAILYVINIGFSIYGSILRFKSDGWECA